MPRGRQRPGGLYAVAHPISEKAVKQPGIAAGQLKGLQWMVKLNGILADKIMMWAPTVKMISYKGNPAQRRNLKVLLTAHEYIIKNRPILSKLKWVHMIIAESFSTSFFPRSSTLKSFDKWFNTPFANSGTGNKIELNEEEVLLIIRQLHKV
ncbi:hypothetical protein EV424DRAFT_1554254 [Suillus variegatus]|nr:hypothetical protein EV424DRAFT_1554254 [Suillus variegatus]